jgi:hypothetical protein
MIDLTQVPIPCHRQKILFCDALVSKYIPVPHGTTFWRRARTAIINLYPTDWVLDSDVGAICVWGTSQTRTGLEASLTYKWRRWIYLASGKLIKETQQRFEVSWMVERFGCRNKICTDVSRNQIRGKLLFSWKQISLLSTNLVSHQPQQLNWMKSIFLSALSTL